MPRNMDLSRSNVWTPENRDFPPEKWQGVKSHVKLLNVQWTNGYAHTVGWQDEHARNQWFEDYDRPHIDITTSWNYKSLEVFKAGLGKHVGAIQVETPYEEAQNFNYAFVEMGEQPVPGAGVTPRREHYFYFITSLNKINPSTTELYLELDTWTTFLNVVTISGLKLQRGHYAHALTSADKYLENPLENSLGLTDPEPDLPDVKPMVSSENFISFQKDGPRVCIATTADFSKPDSFWFDVRDINDFKKASEKAVPAENWWDQGNYTTDTTYLGSDGYAPVPAVGDPAVNGNVPGVRVYSIAPEDYNRFISFMRKRMPHVIKTIQAVFLLDETLVDEGNQFSAFGFDFKPVIQQGSAKLVESFKLTKDMFNYDQKFEKFAKLYTRQFAILEVSNANGQKAEISVEEIAGELEVYARSCAAFPFLKLEAFLNGIGGSEKKTYAVKPWTDSTATLFKSQWEDYKFDLEVPMFGVFLESHEERGPKNKGHRYDATQKLWTRTMIENYNINTAREIAEKNSAKELTNATESIDTTFSNTTDSISRALLNASDNINLGYENSIQSLGRVYTNALALNIFELDSSSARVNVAYTKDTDAIAVEFSNSTAVAETEKAIAARTALVNYKMAEKTIEKDYDVADYENDARDDLYDVTREVAKASAQLNIFQMADTAKIGAAAGALNTIGAAALGGPTAAIGSSITAMVDMVVAEKLLEINSMALANQTNLVNSDDQVDIDIYTGGMLDTHIYYTGQSFNAATHRFNQDVHALNYSSNFSVNYDNNITAKDNELLNISDILENTSTVLAASRDLGNLNAQRTVDVETDIIRTKKTLSDTIASRNNTVDLDVAERNKHVSTNVAGRDNSVDSEIARKSRDTETTIATRNNLIELENIKQDADVKSSNVNSRAESERKSMSVEYYDELLDSPTVYGENSGAAWIDAWGQRGLDIRVRRCSPAVEQAAGNTFYRYGYTSTGLWIENPDLSLMEHFTYWECEDVWIFGDLINETNKALIRQIFKDGVTIWSNPDDVCAVDITNNKTKEN